MMKVLIAVDGSDHANRAIEAIANIARRGVPIEAALINVRVGAILEPLFATDYSMITVQKLDAEQESQQTAVIESATKLANMLGLALTAPVRAYGNVVKEILRVAKERDVDMIVLGTRGMGALRSMLMGSVAQKVLHDSPVPVVFVK
jgi:nucleotide-binding universal stress UspA family protein